MKPVKNKWKIVLILLFAVIWFTIPRFYEIYYPVFYYITGTLIVSASFIRIMYDEKLEERFYNKWGNARKKGFLPNMLAGSVLYITAMFLIVCISQLFVNNLTPVEIIRELPGYILLVLFLVLLFFGLLAGLVRWHENEKKYNRIYYSKKHSLKFVVCRLVFLRIVNLLELTVYPRRYGSTGSPRTVLAMSVLPKLFEGCTFLEGFDYLILLVHQSVFDLSGYGRHRLARFGINHNAGLCVEWSGCEVDYYQA